MDWSNRPPHVTRLSRAPLQRPDVGRQPVLRHLAHRGDPVGPGPAVGASPPARASRRGPRRRRKNAPGARARAVDVPADQDAPRRVAGRGAVAPPAGAADSAGTASSPLRRLMPTALTGASTPRSADPHARRPRAPAWAARAASRRSRRGRCSSRARRGTSRPPRRTRSWPPDHGRAGDLLAVGVEADVVDPHRRRADGAVALRGDLAGPERLDVAPHRRAASRTGRTARRRSSPASCRGRVTRIVSEIREPGRDHVVGHDRGHLGVAERERGLGGLAARGR